MSKSNPLWGDRETDREREWEKDRERRERETGRERREYVLWACKSKAVRRLAPPFPLSYDSHPYAQPSHRLPLCICKACRETERGREAGRQGGRERERERGYWETMSSREADFIRKQYP